MFDYLQQFNNLPKNLRDQVSSPSVMIILAELENKYKLDLAMIVMKVMIKNITIKNLPAYFISEGNLTQQSAEELTRELKEKVFIGAADYLGIISDIRALDLEKDIKIIISEAGLTLASSELVNRFKNILATYLKGIRAKIDTRSTLAKEVISGGLSLSSAEIDRVFKVCEAQKFKSLNISISPSPSPVNSTLSNRPVPIPNRLDKIINSSEGRLSAATKMADYNLKDVIARGQIQKPALLNLPEVEKQLDLPKEENVLRLEKDLKIDEQISVLPIKLIDPIKLEQPNISFVAVIPKLISIPVPPSAPLKQSAPIFSKPQVDIRKTIAPQVKQEFKAPVTPLIPSTPIVMPRPSLARQTLAESSSRPTMHDIKSMPKVMGPIEELQFLDVVNFRRLGVTPDEAVIKIFNKIKQLEKEGYDKMVTGIRAWRQSPVNRLYVAIGQEAISKGMTIKDAALDRQKTNSEYLKIEEIEAIVNLNSKLVF